MQPNTLESLNKSMQSMKTSLLSLALMATLGFALPTTLSAQAAPAADKKEEVKKEEPPKRDQKALDYEKATKDLKKYEGAFTIYQRKKEILVELPEDKIGKLFYVQASFNTGFGGDPIQAGSPIGGDAVDVYMLEKREEEVWLVRPNLKYRWDEKDPLGLSASRSFPKAILNDYRIEQYNPETKKYLINMTTLFTGEMQQLTMMVSFLGGGQYAIDRDKTGIEAVTQTGDLTKVRMDMHFAGRPGGGMEGLAALFGVSNQAEDSRSIPLKVTWTLQFRSENNDFMPRLADPRVGYFTADHFAVDRFFKQDRTNRYILRYDLKKKDPKAAMSEPVKPIVWTIDPSIPERYRDAVRDGVLRWNKAFEAIGYKNAVVVQDAPKDGSYDHAAGGQNVIRTTMTSDSAYMIALFRQDPFTGQILNASVNMDANFMSYLGNEYLMSAVPSSQGFAQMKELATKGFTKSFAGTESPMDVLLGREVKRNKEAEKIMKRFGWTMSDCSYSDQFRRNAAMTYRMMQASGLTISREDYISKMIADVIAHEVGHCLGLRHNFIASTNLTTAELGDPACCDEHATAASVMDYTPTNVVAMLNGTAKNLANNSIGAYDMFAIKYGYMDRAGASPEGERFALSQVARQSGAKGHAYMSDEDADGVDPYVVRFDHAKDPLNYKAKEIEAFKKTRSWALKNLPRNGESYAERNMAVLMSYIRQIRTAMEATAFIGGVVGNRNFKGDVNEKPTLKPIDPAIARQAMRMIAKEGLSMSSLDVPESVLQNMSLDYNTGTGNQYTAPIRSLLVANQLMILGQVLSVDMATSILENEFKFSKSKKAYTLDEHYTFISNAVFAELVNRSSVSSIRRELQMVALTGMIAQASALGGQVPADVQRISSEKVQMVKGLANAALANGAKIDAPTKSHLKEMVRLIQLADDRLLGL